MASERLLQRVFDLRADLRRMLREAAELFQHLQALKPVAAFLLGVGEETEERVRLRTLFGLSQRFRDGEERFDVGRIAIELRHPERLDVVKLLFVDPVECVFAERHEARIVLIYRRIFTSALKTSNGSSSLRTMWRR